MDLRIQDAEHMMCQIGGGPGPQIPSWSPSYRPFQPPQQGFFNHESTHSPQGRLATGNTIKNVSQAGDNNSLNKLK